MPAFGYGRGPGRLKSDGMSPAQREAYVALRAARAMTLRPWAAECLLLRAADRRIRGRVVGAADRAAQRGLPRNLGAAEAERIGLWHALEALRSTIATFAGGKAKLARTRGRPSPRRNQSSPLGDVLSVEVVRIDACLVDRVCPWPRLPRRCSVKRAAALLGVCEDTIGRWIHAGKLTGRRARHGRRGRLRWEVGYPPTSRLVARFTGETVRHPRRARRLMGPEGDATWAAVRFAANDLTSWAVRIGRWQEGGPQGQPVRQLLWLCPSCSRAAEQLYLPAGAQAKAGRTWGPWRFQCRACTGVESEAEAWSHAGTDALNLTMLKLTAGRLSGNEFRKGLQEMLSGKWDEPL